MPRESRAKTYLAKSVKARMRAVTPGDLGLSEDFKIRVIGEGSDWLQFAITDPVTGHHYLMVKVTEKFT